MCRSNRLSLRRCMGNQVPAVLFAGTFFWSGGQQATGRGATDAKAISDGLLSETLAPPAACALLV